MKQVFFTIGGLIFIICAYLFVLWVSDVKVETTKPVCVIDGGMILQTPDCVYPTPDQIKKYCTDKGGQVVVDSEWGIICATANQ